MAAQLDCYHTAQYAIGASTSDSKGERKMRRRSPLHMSQHTASRRK